ncbi:retrovirus-related pol polyprotein from transposon TNT 1-94 [Tanacetum coccineum]
MNHGRQSHIMLYHKLKKALYGLKQAPRTWYDMLLKFLLSQEFSKGTVDPTLFIRRQGKDLLLFKISMMGKISFFLGLHISQSPRGIFINQSKYALESLKKYGIESSDPVDTPMVEKSKLKKYTSATVDPTQLTVEWMAPYTLITWVAKILDEVHLEVCNYWETNLLVGHPKGRKVMRYPVRKLNILLCLAVVLKSFG